MSFAGVLLDARISLRFHPSVQLVTQFTHHGLNGVGIGKVLQFIGIAGRVINRFGRAMHVSLHQVVGLWRFPRIPNPSLPVRIVQQSIALDSHQVFFDIQVFGSQVADVTIRSVTDRADWIRRTFGDIVVDTISVFSMSVGITVEH